MELIPFFLDWFDYPTVYMKDGSWIVEVPAGLQDKLGPSQSFATLADVFDMQARSAPLYREYITDTLTTLRDEGRKFGALIMEPVVLGVAGMVFA
jgi:dethiobiotin synthetase/adenosylmethionine--8-amino-7-oxononanoate aminotransferase